MVKFGGAVAYVKQRSNGYWGVRWREAGKDCSTTRADKEEAIKYAETKVRALSVGQGGKMLTVEDAQLVQQLKRLCGNRSAFGLLDQIENAVNRFGGLDVIGRAIRHYEDSGLSSVSKIQVHVAKSEILDQYELKRDIETLSTLRKELNAFCREHEMLVCDLSNAIVEAWVSRKKADGEAVTARTYNNRLDLWRTFLNWCRKKNYWPKGEKHPGELLEREPEPKTIPEIWTVETAKKALQAVQEEKPRLLNQLVIGCWMGMRPEEMRRLSPASWDWERGYVEVSAVVAAKVGQDRFVPIPDNVRQLLGGKMEDPRTKKKTRGRWEPVCVGTEDMMYLSAFLRDKDIIEEWVPDVMRHSYVSYRIGQGHGFGQVAEWCGNSESEIRKVYRRPLRKEDGEAWFQIGM